MHQLRREVTAQGGRMGTPRLDSNPVCSGCLQTPPRQPPATKWSSAARITRHGNHGDISRIRHPGISGSVSESRGQFKHSPRRRTPPGACFDRARRARAHQPRSPLPRTRPLTGTCHQRSRSPCQLLTARATKSITMLRSWCAERGGFKDLGAYQSLARLGGA